MSTLIPRAMGWLPDPVKEAAIDWGAAELLGTSSVREAASARHLVTEILDQGALGSCTANAAMQAIRASHLKQGAPANVPFGSRLFAYYFARATHGATTVDSGTWLRAVFEVLNKLGFPPESEWPYSDLKGSDARAWKMPGTLAVRAAYDQMAPTEYRRIYEMGYDRIEMIKRAIDRGHLVCFGTDVSTLFTSNDFDPTEALEPPEGEPIAGGHAMCIAAYDGDDFDVPNSYGPLWGAEGWCKFSADYLTWGSSRDFWIVESAPRFSEGE